MLAPFATEVYADAIDQPFRDYAERMPAAASAMPLSFAAAAAIAAGVVGLARRRGVVPRGAVLLLGPVAAVCTGAYYVVLMANEGDPVITLAVAAVAGAVTGWFGWQCATLLRRLGDRTEAAR